MFKPTKPTKPTQRMGQLQKKKKAYSWFKHQKLMRRLSIVVSEWSDYAPAIYQMEN